MHGTTTTTTVTTTTAAAAAAAAAPAAAAAAVTATHLPIRVTTSVTVTAWRCLRSSLAPSHATLTLPSKPYYGPRSLRRWRGSSRQEQARELEGQRAGKGAGACGLGRIA